MARLRESPRALQALAVAWLASFVVGSLLDGGNAPVRIYVQAFIVLLIAAFFLLRGSRIAWVLFAVGSGAAVVSVLPKGGLAWGFFHLTLLVVLFTPEARRYVWRRRA